MLTTNPGSVRLGGRHWPSLLVLVGPFLLGGVALGQTGASGSAPRPAGSAAASGSAAPAGAAAASSASASAPGSRPPAYMFQDTVPPEQQLPPPPPGGPKAPASPTATPPTTAGQVPPAPPGPPPPPPPPPVYTPSRLPAYPGAAPIYVYEPLPPPPLRHRAPVNALWFGVRGGVLFPAGTAYEAGTGTVDAWGDPIVYSERWSDLAGAGPSVEVDVGGRFSRNYILYGLWEHAWLSSGNDPVRSAEQGDGARTDFAGMGFRWSSNPNSVGFVADLALGYRWFRESWPGGVKVDLQGFGETRLGIGADIRVSNALSLSPMFAISLGSFTDRSIPALYPGQPSYSGAHNTMTLTLGAHYDWPL